MARASARMLFAALAAFAAAPLGASVAVSAGALGAGPRETPLFPWLGRAEAANPSAGADGAARKAHRVALLTVSGPADPEQSVADELRRLQERDRAEAAQVSRLRGELVDEAAELQSARQSASDARQARAMAETRARLAEIGYIAFVLATFCSVALWTCCALRSPAAGAKAPTEPPFGQAAHRADSASRPEYAEEFPPAEARFGRCQYFSLADDGIAGSDGAFDGRRHAASGFATDEQWEEGDPI
mmetsp:Transcript_34760/g.100703  ORF Transcript_34760/g.100703 Transcript_34760/m.100703 type:complete len:245 (-) Transcript_34760:77-811(-)